MSEDNVIYIGRKRPMAYVLAVMSAINDHNADSVILKARGRAISTAVDVAEITRNRYMTDLKLGGIEIDTEEVPLDEGGTRNVSSIAINLVKGEAGSSGTPEEETTPRDLDITEINGVGPATEEKLKRAGYETPQSIAETDPSALALRTGISEKIAEKIVEASKALIKE